LALDEGHNPDFKPLQRVELSSEMFGEGNKLQRAPNGAGGEPVFEAMGMFPPSGSGARAVKLRLVPFYAAGQDGSRFEVWIRLPGAVGRADASLFYLADESWSHPGNVEGSIADDDTGTFRVSFDGTEQEETWFAVSLTKPAKINRVVYAHGHSFHDGGWYDASAGNRRSKPSVQGGRWEQLATIDSYPDTTATTGRGLRDGRAFTIKFAPTEVWAIRVVGKPAHGDTPGHAFASCAELQGFLDP